MSTVEDQYLKLEELGSVLRQLSSDFPGWCMPTFAFIIFSVH